VLKINGLLVAVIGGLFATSEPARADDSISNTGQESARQTPQRCRGFGVRRSANRRDSVTATKTRRDVAAETAHL